MSKKKKSADRDRSPEAEIAATEERRSGLKLWERSWFPVALFALISLIYFSEFLFSDKIVYGYDVHPPEEATFAEKLARISQPMWNPQMGGFPQSEEARPQYFPTQLIYLFTPYMEHLGWRYILTVFLTGWMMFSYMRELQVDRRAALWVGVAYMSAPTFLSFLFAGHYAKMSVIALFPLMCLLLEKGMKKGKLVHFAGLGATIGVGIYSPHVQMIYYCLLALGLYFLLRVVPIFRSEGIQGLKRSVFFALAVVLGLGLGAEGLFPSYLYAKTESKRASGQETGKSPEEQLAFAQSWSLHPEEVGSLLVPEFGGFDDLARREYRYWGRNTMKSNSEYFGALVLLLALACVPDMRRRPIALFMGVLFALTLAYTLGGHTPVHWLAFHLLPGGKVLRTIGMAAFLFSFAACVLAGLSLSRLLQEEESEGEDRGLLIIGGVLTGLALLVALAPRGVTDAWISLFYSDITPQKRQVLAAGYGWLARGGLYVALVVGCGTILLHFRRKIGAVPVIAGLCVLTLFDTWRIDRVFLEYRAPAASVRNENARVARFLEQEEEEKGLFRLFPVPSYELLRQPGYHLQGANLVTGHHDFTIRRYDRLLREFDPIVGLLSAKYYRGQEVPYTDEALLESALPLLNLLNARYILMPAGIRLDSARFPPAFSGDRLHLYENPQALPWFYLVPSIRVVEDEEEIIRLLKEGEIDPRQTAIVERSLDGFGAAASGDPTDDRIEVEEYDLADGMIRLEAHSSGTRLLVVSENFYSNWSAFIDGEEAEILRVDYVWQGVAVPAGQHRVEFRYRSPVVNASRAATLVSLLAILGICGWEWRKRRGGVAGDGTASA